MTHGVFLVTGRRQYRGHDPGTQFEAALDGNRQALKRAIDRGDIRLLRQIQPHLQAGSYRLPNGWIPPDQELHPAVTEAPEGAFSMPEGG